MFLVYEVFFKLIFILFVHGACKIAQENKAIQGGMRTNNFHLILLYLHVSKSYD